MPSYFYHISLQFLPRSPPNSTLDESHNHNQATSPRVPSVRKALLPFQKEGEQTTKSSGSKRAPDQKDWIRCQISSGAANPSTPVNIPSSQPFISSSLPFRPYYSPLGTEKDLRVDSISIESIDMVAVDQQQQSSGAHLKHVEKHSADGGKSSDNSTVISTGIGTDILGGLNTKGKYTPLDRKVSDSIWGIVHLYRDTKETPSLMVDDYPSYLKGSSAARQPTDQLGSSSTSASYRQHFLGGDSSSSTANSSNRAQPIEDCTTLCVLAVPSYLSPSDFLGFAGEAASDDVSHFRMIRTARANRYMVLMKFRSGKKAMEWQRQWNGKIFNSMEPETCHVVFVKTVEIQAASPRPNSTLPNIEDKILSSPELSTSPSRPVVSTNQPTSLASASLSAKPLAPPTPALIELPTCPVCLERMDETTGLLTIICQHVFHCTCLQKWKGTGCPVCRYTQDDFSRRGQSLDPNEVPGECSVCHSELNLWICLVCGNIGCGRYDGAHAFAHFKQTSHAFAMDLSTQRVWDYVSDGYVHRIIQRKSDGKLVELPSADNSALDPPDWADAVPREKLENMSVEYTHLLTSQLESQRTYFEEIVERAADKASQASATASSVQNIADEALAKLEALQGEYNTLARETVPNLDREKNRAERRAEKFETMAHKLEKEWREEKAMTESLMKRVEFLSEEVEKLKAVNADLSEQNRDLTFFISGSERLKDQGEDVMEGTVTLPEDNSKKKGKGRKR